MELLLSHSHLTAVTGHDDDLVMLLGAVSEHQQAGGEIANINATDGGASTEYHLPDTPPTDPEEFRKHLIATRMAEHATALRFAGISPANQYASRLPDGELLQLEHLEQFAHDLAVNAVHSHSTTFITLGPEGFDGHKDHIASHEAACVAARALKEVGIHVPILALNATGKGEYVVPINDGMKQKKMDFLRHYPSQMKFHADGTPDPAFFDRMMGEYGYAKIFERETYDYIEVGS